jgi:UDP-N-acetylmuramyl pentapeptide phosphotransferase/UDP-N-acetylglucosamine-1-phosphate transferase/glycosyltransferase involved in cell wall biosynthesis
MAVLVAAVSAWVGALLLAGSAWGRRQDLDDRSHNLRKVHSNPTPRLGGIAVAVGLMSGLLAAGVWQGQLSLGVLLLVCVAPGLLWGLIEDLSKRGAVFVRLVFTALAAALGFFLLDARITGVDIPALDGLLEIHAFSFALTLVAVAGVASSINMIDGLNGLSGFTTLLASIGLAVVAWAVNDAFVFTAACVVAASMAGFLPVNFPRGRIFLGDGGAYLAGLVLAFLSLMLVQRNTEVSAWFPLLLLAYPIWETLFSIFRRFCRRVSPLHPDALHLHTLVYHRFVRWKGRGSTVSDTTPRKAAASVALWCIPTLCFALAVGFWNQSRALQLIAIGFILGYGFIYRRIVRFGVPPWLVIRVKPGQALANLASRRSGSRIFFVNRFFFPDLSATSHLLTELTLDLAERSEVHVVTSRLKYDDPAGRLPSRGQHRGVTIHRVWTTGFGRYSLLGRAVDYLTFYGTCAVRLMCLLRSGDVVVIKTDPPLLSIVAAPVARLRGARLVNWLQDIFPEVVGAVGIRLFSGRLGRLVQRLRDWSLAAAEVNVVVGDAMREVLRRRGIPEQRLRVIANWADGAVLLPSAPEQNALRCQWRLSERFIVAYSGNMGRVHEYETILDAAELLRASRRIAFVFIGGGVRMRELKAEARRRELGLSFMDYQPRESLAQSLGAADLHLVCLRPQAEGLVVPSKFYGIAAVGRPVIYVGEPEGDLGSVVRRLNCGIALRSGDGRGLAEAISGLAANPDLCRALGNNARSAFEANWNRTLAAGKWADLLAAARVLPAPAFSYEREKQAAVLADRP